MLPRKPTAPPVVYVSPDSEKLLQENAALVRLVEDLRGQLADLPGLRAGIANMEKELATYRSGGPRVSLSEYQEETERRMRAEGYIRKAEQDRNAAQAEAYELRIQLAALTPSTAIDEDPAGYGFNADGDTSFEPDAILYPHLVPDVAPVAAPEIRPATTPGEAIAAYARARDALSGRDPSAMRSALAGLPVWPSKKCDALKTELTAALRIAA